MKKINYTHNDWILSGLLFFSIFGVVYLYCSGVDSWENVPEKTKEKCIEYYTGHLRKYGADKYWTIRYTAALDTVHYSSAWKIRNTCFLFLYIEAALAHYVRDLDWKEALPYYILASGCRGDEPYQYLDLAGVYTDMAHIYSKRGENEKRDHFLKKAGKMLAHCREQKKLQKDKFLDRIAFDHAAVKARILAGQGKFLPALAILDKNAKKDPTDFSLFLGSDFVRAEIYRKMGKEQAFKEELERLDHQYRISRLPGIPPYLYHHLVSCYEKNKEYKKCVSFLKAQIERVDRIQTKSLFMLDLARIYQKMGEKEKAFFLMQKTPPVTTDSEARFHKSVRKYEL